jgi:hypothetical protein
MTANTILFLDLDNPVTIERLKAAGFRYDEGKDDFGFIDNDWRFETDKFLLVVDMYSSVRLYRKNPDSDAINLKAQTVSDLIEIADWMRDEA